jgi:TM2 domain-containing membrane protein YozV
MMRFIWTFIVLYFCKVTEAIHKELYTTNAICRRKYCINPIFPGLEDLHRLDKAKWVCATLQKSVPSMDFCKGAINYNPAFPSPEGDSSLAVLVKKQEQAAITMYAYHLSGMGIEYWDHTRPDLSDDDCIKSVWRMSCFTYFPKASVGCKEGQETKYLRPCQSSCFNYIRACGVECCDESVQCVFEHTKTLNSKSTVKTAGYAEHDGPSSMCTGGARRSGSGSIWIVLLCIFFSLFQQSEGTASDGFQSSQSFGHAQKILRYGCMAIIAGSALLLQGCDSGSSTHKVGNWRAEQDYLINYQFVPPGSDEGDAKLNSCSMTHIAQTLQCSGRGICKAWDPDDISNPLALCECDRAWADPECRTPRQSQVYAYFLSLLSGFLGLDQFYLGFPGNGAAKLLTLGGFGVWWIMDIVRIGSAPVYAHDFRVANDLPHWAFTVSSVTFFFMIGFALVVFQTAVYRKGKRKDAMLLMQEEEARGAGEPPLSISELKQKGIWQHPRDIQDMHRYQPGPPRTWY